ncbi:hypothetical protein AVEN_187773-1 [Araneus ventricosus]|uniref:Tesmin/TSO1-like CXC domain-containing protein n=1 Tax=Araneus ventricosus TaxID=182803 RepID=A0A4Y2C2A3_ARAVE|nr:hypothetical protein AVEN_187773-1 [Araneus ventricosus]
MGMEGNKAWVAPFHINSRTSPTRTANSSACKCSKGCRNACGCRKQGMKCPPICFNYRVATCTIVPKDIKNRPKLDDDVIISHYEAVEELLDEDADNDFEQVQFLQLTSPKNVEV